MDENEARREIDIIRSMLDKTRRATLESGTLFIVWGVLITLALAGTAALAVLKLYNWEWLVWVGVTVVGWVFSAVYGYRRDKRTTVKTYAQIAIRYLSIACGAGFLLVGLALPRLGAYSYEAITILIAVVSGVLFFVLGGLLEWRLLTWCGLVWWAGSVGLSLLDEMARLILYTVLFVGAYLVPAIILRARFKKERSAP